MGRWSNGPYTRPVEGYIVHGSRSGSTTNNAVDEFWAITLFTKNRTDGLGYQATVGPDLVSMGIPWGEWAWHARECSTRWVGFELAQPTELDPIDDATVNALVWCILQDRAHRQARGLPPVPLVFRTHAEVDNTAEYGIDPATGRSWNDGKTDVFAKGSPKWDELFGRIQARLRLFNLEADRPS